MGEKRVFVAVRFFFFLLYSVAYKLIHPFFFQYLAYVFKKRYMKEREERYPSTFCGLDANACYFGKIDYKRRGKS